MLRPLSLLPALVAAATVAVLMVAAPVPGVTASPAGAAERRDETAGNTSGNITGSVTGGLLPRERIAGLRQSPSRSATSRAARTSAPAAAPDPLDVSIGAITPSTIPQSGPVEITGAVTNRTDETWSAINLHAFISPEPMTTSAELAEAVAVDPEVYVGDRITTAGTFFHVEELAPGESSTYTIRVPRSELEVSAPGVYWFGVHALGDSSVPRDETADGRARTFIPLVPANQDESVDTALVIPLRRHVAYRGDGRVADVRGWADSLSAGGALRSLVDFGASAGSRPVTWLVDPAVPDSVRTLVAGNPPRSLADEPRTGGDGESPREPTEEPEATAEPASEGDTDEDGGADGSEETDEAEPRTNAATAPGAAWLAKVEGAMTGDQILALPYGDVDVSAAIDHDPSVYKRATLRSGDTLEPWGLGTTPAVAPPKGYLDPATLPAVSRRSTVLVADRELAGTAPPVAKIAGHRVLPTSWSTEQGGPQPGNPLDPVALRQRILSEAAVRLLDPEQPSLVVTMPENWHPESTIGFFGGLDVDWLDLTSVGAIAQGSADQVDADTLHYPPVQGRRELDAANFASASALSTIGHTLQNVLARNDAVAAVVDDEALTTLSYASRVDPDTARANADRSYAWISRQLSSIQVEAPPAVTLASSSGRFATTITNRLDHPVTVRVEAESDEPITIETPEQIDIAAESSTSVLLRAATDRLGVHNVQLVVTDESGTPLGSADELPIRSVQVSQVIWLILGTGVALLFGAIGVRLVRRIRKARA